MSMTSTLDDTTGEPTGNTSEQAQSQQYVYIKVSLSKPMGLLMEEVEEGAPRGVFVADMASGSVLQRQEQGRSPSLICMGDTLVQIGDDDSCDSDPIDALALTFDQVMTILANSSPDPVVLTFRRKAHHVAVLFASTGMAISCPPGTPLRQLSRETRARIPYDCNSGYCGTCEQIMFHGDQAKTIRPCVAKVGTDSKEITIANPDCYLFGVPPPF